MKNINDLVKAYELATGETMILEPATITLTMSDEQMRMCHMALARLMESTIKALVMDEDKPKDADAIMKAIVIMISALDEIETKGRAAEKKNDQFADKKVNELIKGCE